MMYYRKFPRIARLLIILIIGAIIFGAMLYVVKGGEETVLLYLSQPGTDHEVVMKSSLSNSPEVFLSGFGSLQEMNPSPDGKWLAIITMDENENFHVQVYAIRTAKLENDYRCEAAQCSALEWNTDASQLYFRIHSDGMNSRILSMQVEGGQVLQVSLKDQYTPTYFSISPDERYQVVYDENKKGFFVLDNWDKELVLMKSEDASGVVWLTDPVRVLMIITEHEEKIPVSHIVEITTETLKIRYLEDSEITNMDFNHLTLHPNGEDLVFGCRPVQRTTSRQLCVSNVSEFVGEQLTNVQSRNHAGAAFDSSGTWLAYQTYDPESSMSVPTIWVLNWDTESTIPVEENATMPHWVP